MIVYIPRHLDNIGIVHRMTDLLREYIKTYGLTETRSFDYYYYNYTLDPVTNFLRMCLSHKSVSLGFTERPEDAEIPEGVLWYLTKLFYSVKGTPKVLELMESELGLEFIPGPDGSRFIYDQTRIEYGIKEINTFNLSSFVEAQTKFLEALLYYGDLKTFIETAALTIAENLESEVSVGAWSFKKHEVKDL